MCKFCEKVEYSNELYLGYPEFDEDEAFICYHIKDKSFKLHMGQLGHHRCTITNCPWCGQKLEKK